MFHNTDTEMYIPLGMGSGHWALGNYGYVWSQYTCFPTQVKGELQSNVLVGQRRHTSLPSYCLLNVKKGQRNSTLDTQILFDVSLMLLEGRSRNYFTDSKFQSSIYVVLLDYQI